MPNLTAALPKRTGDIETDFDNLYKAHIALVDEMKQILCNLDSGNVAEAASVKAQNIDATQARIKDAQIASLTANKLTAGIIDTGQIAIRGEDDNGGSMVLTGDLIVFYDDKHKERIVIGNDNGKYIFAVQSFDKKGKVKEGIFMDEDGRVYMTGDIQTDKDCRIAGELSVGLSGNNTKGISFYGDTNTSVPSELYGRMRPYVDTYDDHIKGIEIIGNLFINGKKVLTEDNTE